MKTKLPSFLFPVFISVILGLNTKVMATHVVGGEITYQWLGGNDYKVTAYFYRDCSGVSAPSTIPINISNTCLLTNPLLNVALINPSTGLICSGPVVDCAEEVPVVCPSDTSMCSIGGIYLGFQRYTYEGIVTLPGNCSDWRFSYSINARNCSSNLSACPVFSGGSGEAFYIESFLNNFSTPFNNSPVFFNWPVMVLPVNQPALINNGTIETDGDSLVFSLESAKNSFAGYCSYNAPYSGTNPIASSSSTTLNSATGDISFTPNATGLWVFVVSIKEYRMGNLIGVISRDIEVFVTTEANNLPEVLGLGGSGVFSLTVCPGAILNFSIPTYDADLGQNITLTWDSAIGGASFSASGSPFPTGTFSWNPDTADVSPFPHLFTVTVRDDFCPYMGVQNFAFSIFVQYCDSGLVWPGDANNDYEVNMYDILPLGIGYGETGLVRPGANLSWTSQYCPDWPNFFASGLNQKHADCNGDGTIDSLDLAGLSLNFGSSHLWKVPDLGTFLPANPELKMVIPMDTLSSSTNVSIPVYLGNASIQVNNAYGIAMTFNFPAEYIEPGSMEFVLNDGWFSQPNNRLVLSKDFSSSGKFSQGIVRNNQIPVSGNGLIGSLNFNAFNTSGNPGWLSMYFSDVKMVDEIGEEISLNLVSDSSFMTNTHQHDWVNKSEIMIYPNPCKDFIQFDSRDLRIDRVEVLNLLAEKLFESTIPVAGIQTIGANNWPKGFYIVKFHTAEGIFTKRVVKE